LGFLFIDKLIYCSCVFWCLLIILLRLIFVSFSETARRRHHTRQLCVQTTFTSLVASSTFFATATGKSSFFVVNERRKQRRQRRLIAKEIPLNAEILWATTRGKVIADKKSLNAPKQISSIDKPTLAALGVFIS